jgi:tRNA(Ile)-lysidine synthetase-like protein
MSLRATLWTYSQRHHLLAPGRAVLVGVSGGPDSLCLLDVLSALAAEYQFPLAVAHLDHGLRSEAAAEAAFVRAEAAARGLAFYTETADTRAYATQHHLSIEAAARALRYAFLARAARQAGASHVAVAHTADDQAETVLMHFLRGSGLAGLRGMRPSARLMVPEAAANLEGPPADASPLILIRPLLGTTRQAVESYCAEHALAPRQDPSNADLAYHRNRLRHAVLPALARLNPNLNATLARTAEVLAGEYELAERYVAGLWPQVAPAAEQRAGQAVFDRAAWQQLGLPEQRAVLRRGAAQVLGDARDLDFAPLDAAARFAAEAAPGRSCEVARSLRLTVEPERLRLHMGALPGPDYPLLLDEDGRLPAEWRLVVEPDTEAGPTGGWQASVAAAALTEPLVVRARRRGERFQPAGMGGQHMKLSDFMINAKVAAAARDRWPVVVCGAAVVWLPGLRLDERFRPLPETPLAGRVRLRFALERQA